jgi:hypothetical protein
MIDLVQRLLDNGHAYRTDDGSVFYDISSFPDYGKLSRIPLEDVRAGERVAADEYEKGDARDFALWKGAKDEDREVGAVWPAPWGEGRPGWHLECSAMSMAELGETFDIHTGGEDLVFPHHEDEIAQSEGATGKPFVRYWLHARHLMMETPRRCPSPVGNVVGLADVLDAGYPPAAVRYLLLSAHYRKELSFSYDGLDDARAAVRRILDFARTGSTPPPRPTDAPESDLFPPTPTGRWRPSSAAWTTTSTRPKPWPPSSPSSATPTRLWTGPPPSYRPSWSGPWRPPVHGRRSGHPGAGPARGRARSRSWPPGWSRSWPSASRPGRTGTSPARTPFAMSSSRRRRRGGHAPGRRAGSWRGPAPRPGQAPDPRIADDADVDHVITVLLNEWAVELDRDTIAPGSVRLRVRNNGEHEHAVTVQGSGVSQRTENIPSGQWAVLDLDLQPGTYEVACPLDAPVGQDHAGRGMTAVLTVSEAPPTDGPAEPPPPAPAPPQERPR